MDNNEAIGVLRIIDANANRAVEALRTIEEYVRFVVNDAHLSQATKSLRHRLATITQLVSLSDLAAARESQNDVGRNLTTTEETDRDNVLAVVTAAFGRLKQALRCLEEYSKTMFSDAAELFEQLRYDVYQLEKMIINASSRTSDLFGPRCMQLLMDEAVMMNSVAALTSCAQRVLTLFNYAIRTSMTKYCSSEHCCYVN